MEFRQAEQFLAIVEHGGVVKAAAALRLAQPSVSQAIKGLEREVGTPLFHRVGRGLVLTAAGRALVQPARDLLRQVDLARASVSQLAGELTGTLSLAAMGVCFEVLLPAVGRFRQSHPQAQVRLDSPVVEADVVDRISHGTSELGLLYVSDADEDRRRLHRAGLDVELWGTRELVLLMPPGTDPELPDPLPVSMVGELDLRTMAAPDGALPRAAVEEALRAAGVRTRLSLVMPYRKAHPALVSAGAGSAFVSREGIQWAVEHGAVARSLEPAITIAFGLARRPGVLSPEAEAFIEIAHRMGEDEASFSSIGVIGD